MKKMDNFSHLNTERVHTLTTTEQKQIKGGVLFGITCEEKRGIITGKPYMAMTGMTVLGIKVYWG